MRITVTLSHAAGLVALSLAGPVSAQAGPGEYDVAVRLERPNGRDATYRWDRIRDEGLLDTLRVTVLPGDSIKGLIAAQGILADRDALAVFYDLNPHIWDVDRVRQGESVLVPTVPNGTRVADARAAGGNVRLIWLPEQKRRIDRKVRDVQRTIEGRLDDPGLDPTVAHQFELTQRTLSSVVVGGAGVTTDWLSSLETTLDELGDLTVNASMSDRSVSYRVASLNSGIAEQQVFLASGARADSVDVSYVLARGPNQYAVPGEAELAMRYTYEFMADILCDPDKWLTCGADSFVPSLGDIDGSTVLLFSTRLQSWKHYRMVVHRGDQAVSCVQALHVPTPPHNHLVVNIYPPDTPPPCGPDSDR